MEPNYNDPNYWTRWYAEQHELQRAREESDDMPANQTGFEQQLTNLQLSSPEESSSDRSSPDIRPTEPHEIVTRTESMRTPPRFNLRDDAFGSMRRSVDVPRLTLVVRRRVNPTLICATGRSKARAIQHRPNRSPRPRRRTAKAAVCGRVSSLGSEMPLGETVATSRPATRRPTRSIKSFAWIS